MHKSSLLHSTLELLTRTHQNHPSQIAQIHALLLTTAFFTPSTPPPAAAVFNVLIRSTLCYPNPSLPAFHLLSLMLSLRTSPTTHTFPSLLKSSSSIPPLHAHVVKWGAGDDNFVASCLVSRYSDVGRFGCARKVFEELPRPDLGCFNAVIDGICKGGDVEWGVGLFWKVPEKDVVSWTTVINGFVVNRKFTEAVWWFRRMVEVGELPNESTVVCVLSALANVAGGLRGGREVHGYLVRREFKLTAFLGTALVDMYGKCGFLHCAENVFLDVGNMRSCTYNAMISAFACNGEETRALDLFQTMKKNHHLPNSITFVAILTACARARFVERGLSFFKSMKDDYKLIPTMEHYGCMADLLGRAGLIDEAVELIERMPFEPDGSVLGALLGACRVHGDVNLANEVGQSLLRLQPLHCGRYMVLANVYADAGMWATSLELKQAMEKRGVRKIAGFSALDCGDLSESWK